MIRLAVALPTRNRSDMAMAVVESLLRVGEPDVTVVVSDNSTDEAERARLHTFCARHADDVDYVRPPEPLAMAPHWEWLRREVQGRSEVTHVTYLNDRLLFAAGALAQLAEIVAREPEWVVSYQHDRVEDATMPAELTQFPWTGQLLELDARRLIEMSSRGTFGSYLPRMLNCIVPVGTLTAIERRYGSVFASVSPDYCFAFRCIATCDSILYFDRACIVEYGTGRSSVHTYMKGRPNEVHARFARETSGFRLAGTPEPGFETVANGLYKEYFVAREETGGDRFPAVSPRSYLAAQAVAIAQIEEPEWRSRMKRLLRRHGWKRRHDARRAAGEAAAMAGYFIRHPTAFASSIKRQLWERPPRTMLASLLLRVGVNPRTRDELRFGSAADAIAHAEGHPRRRLPHAWHVHQLERAGAIVRRADPPR
jgi:hypothetical protein